MIAWIFVACWSEDVVEKEFPTILEPLEDIRVGLPEGRHERLPPHHSPETESVRAGEWAAQDQEHHRSDRDARQHAIQ